MSGYPEIRYGKIPMSENEDRTRPTLGDQTDLGAPTPMHTNTTQGGKQARSAPNIWKGPGPKTEEPVEGLSRRAGVEGWMILASAHKLSQTTCVIQEGSIIGILVEGEPEEQQGSKRTRDWRLERKEVEGTQGRTTKTTKCIKGTSEPAQLRRRQGSVPSWKCLYSWLYNNDKKFRYGKSSI